MSCLLLGAISQRHPFNFSNLPQLKRGGGKLGVSSNNPPNPKSTNKPPPPVFNCRRWGWGWAKDGCGNLAVRGWVSGGGGAEVNWGWVEN